MPKLKCQNIVSNDTNYILAVTNYEQALSFLGATHDTADEFIPSMFTLRVIFPIVLLSPITTKPDAMSLSSSFDFGDSLLCRVPALTI